MPALEPDRGFLEVVFDPRYGTFRPTCLAAIGARWALVGPNPDAHHACLVVLHAVNAGMVGWVGRRLGLSGWRAAFAGALFLLAPLRLDAAFSIHAACDLLVAFFCLGFLASMRPPPTMGSALAASLAAFLAVTTKETAFVMVAASAPLLLWDRADGALERPRPARSEVLALGAVGCVLAVAFGARWWALNGVAGSYAEALWRTGPGLRGVLAGILASIFPFELALRASELSRDLLPAGIRRPLLVALASLVALGLAFWVRRSPPSRARRLAGALVLASSVPFLFSVNERSAYVTGIGASLLIATLRVPSRLRWVAPALVMALLVMGSVGRIVAWAEAARVANGVRDAALARAGGARTVYLLASPDTVAGARSSPVSECYALLEPEAPLVLGSLRGESRSGVGPRVEGRRLVAPPGFRFTSQGCGEAEGALPPGIRATVECERGEPRSIEAIGNPAANTRLVAWEGQLRVRAFP